MRKIASVFYIVICLFLCALPFVGMTVAPTNTTTENREMTALPNWAEDGKWNQKYFQQLGEYFNDHFAFRSHLVMADSVIQSKVFGVSNMERVIVGEEGWLYYSSTLPDYLGTERMSEREIFNAANNLSLMKQSVELRGAEFLLTVAPNKNSLYGENMPYYYGMKVNSNSNIEALTERLQEFRIPYADLFAAFRANNETLYLKKDSHWNEKGAVLAYNTILDGLEYEHENYETIANVRTKTTYGDLNRMLYPISLEPEWNYCYEVEDTFSYVTDTKTVEDAWIETVSNAGNDSLLMFRDSFGNTLLPYMANSFGKAYFSKSVPYQLDEYMGTYNPSYVVVEKVERNLSDFAKIPPVMTGPVVEMDALERLEETATTIDLRSAEADADYWQVMGTIAADWLELDTKVYVGVTSSDMVTYYEAFTVTTEEGDNGYLLYLPKKSVTDREVKLEIFVQNESMQKVASVTIEDVSLLGIE